MVIKSKLSTCLVALIRLPLKTETLGIFVSQKKTDTEVF